MPFDPDAFIASAPATNGTFDPDAFLGKPPAPAPKALPTTMDHLKKGVANILAAPEVLANMGTGLVGQAVGGLAGTVAAMLPGEAGQGADVSRKVSESLTYQPRTDAAKYALGKVGEGFEYANTKLGEAGEAVGGNLGRTIGESALPVAMTVAPVPKLVKSYRANPTLVMPKREPMPGFVSDTGEVFSGKDVGYARDNAAKLEAQEIAKKHGIVTDPSLTNPTPLNRAAVAQAGPGDVATRLATTNESKWNKIAASDPDIDIRAPLSIDTIKAVRERAAEPNLEIAKTGTVPVADFHLAEINGLRMKPGIANPNMANAVNAVVDRATTMLKGGMDASQVLDDISQLRETARRNFNNANSTLADIAEAKTSLKIANTLEDMIDTHLAGLAERNPYGGFAELGEAYKQGRRSMAKSYAMEDAFDVNTRQIDPAKIGKMTATDNALTGHFADIGKVAGVFPEIAELGARTKPLSNIHFSRYGIPGVVGSTTGGLLGAITGNPMIAATGAGTGGLIGALSGEVLSKVLRNKVSTPGVQARAVNPVPRSMWDLSDVDPLGPRAPKNPFEYERNPSAPFDAPRLPGPDQGIPPTGPRGPVEGAPAPYTHPNFQYKWAKAQKEPGTGVVPGRPLTPAEQWAQDKANFAAQDRTKYNREAAMDELARQKLEAEAAALRQSAGEGTVMGDRPAPTRLEPLVVKPTSLQRAVNKISKGRQFDLTAEERIAWQKASGTIETLRNVKE